ncbi:hypothetical protein ABVG11_20185 [Streptomyces sp. HD1123-B1]|uniref:hypothetical protein n=1 Tax=Streptomyces huangiella TaxID=3228804 RepID=UPI003D7D5B60
MIASTPVARWAWGRDDDTADDLVLCLRDILIAHSVLSRQGFASGTPKVRVSVKEAGTSHIDLFEDSLTVVGRHDWGEAAEELAHEIRAGLRPGEIGGVSADIDCAGTVLGSAGEVHQEIFRLGADASAGFVTVDLTTFTDIWMAYDLKGRPQPAVYAANAPRLAAALRDLAEALDDETTPDDPTYFGKPTETGVDNRFEPDGTASDVWSRFEIPTRTRVFRHTPPFRAGYRRTADGDVQYVPVHNEHGVLLGYLWASDAESAASYEPREAADEEGRQAGLVWLDRLASAYDRGLSPSQALAELMPGLLEVNVLDLVSLRERAGED